MTSKMLLACVAMRHTAVSKGQPAGILHSGSSKEGWYEAHALNRYIVLFIQIVNAEDSNHWYDARVVKSFAVCPCCKSET